MALVIKSWSVKTSPTANEPYVRILGRESGLLSFLLSLVGVDATTTLVITHTHMEFETGSLSGFIRRITPFAHMSSAFYGRFKPWKTAGGLLLFTLFVSGSLVGKGGVLSTLGLLLLLVGGVGALIYYFLNRELTLGFHEDSGAALGITFKRSVIEGQEINEEALRRIIAIVEHLLAGTPVPAQVSLGGAPANPRLAEAAPTSFREVLQPTRPSLCPACHQPVGPEDTFCGGCGRRLD